MKQTRLAQFHGKSKIGTQKSGIENTKFSFSSARLAQIHSQSGRCFRCLFRVSRFYTNWDFLMARFPLEKKGKERKKFVTDTIIDRSSFLLLSYFSSLATNTRAETKLGHIVTVCWGGWLEMCCVGMGKWFAFDWRKEISFGGSFSHASRLCCFQLNTWTSLRLKRRLKAAFLSWS